MSPLFAKPAKRFAWLGICGLLLPMAAMAQSKEAAQQTLEQPTWSASYEGTIAGKRVKADLWRLGGILMGSYCYTPCSKDQMGIQLEGQLTEQGVEVTEAAFVPAKGELELKPSGRWLLDRQSGAVPQQIQGRWQSMDGKKQWPLKLEKTASDFAHAPAHELRLVMDKHITAPEDCRAGDADVRVSAIGIYLQGRLLQTLKTEAYGSCSFVQPQWVDANFDGWPDLTQSLQLPAGPNIQHNTWLYLPAKKSFEPAPPELQELTSPAFDGKAQRIYSEWRASCCSHGIDIYAWKGRKLVNVESDVSYVLPVRQGGKLMGCYQAPLYKAGHVFWPDALQQTAKGLEMRPVNSENCDIPPEMLVQQGRVDVLAEQKAGVPPNVLRRQEVRWKRVKTRQGPMYCSEVPAFDTDSKKIVRVLLSADPDSTCQKDNPGK